MATNDPTRRGPWDLFAELDARSCWRPTSGASTWAAAIRRQARAWCPPVDVIEEEDEVVVTMELAGGRKEDVEVECRGDSLWIRGEKRRERSGHEEHRRYVERTFGAFERTVPLPATVDPDSVETSFADGVLTVRIRKRPASESQPAGAS